ncbi:hypothetical protein EIP91_004755 [Steccherinum ochraceum]|uniref:F-box domain-containing protein n=1 Tax=Steccherinum ochraceum TaxID=92696 RepID=A0A4R0REE5_9APHY|nr:hypothetical protein EIP91_004755 [Steccherinum ochraceum]
MPAETPTLPTELVEYIITFLWNHPHAVRSCNLVNHQWHAVSQSHIFRRVVIDSSAKLLKFETFVLDNPAVGVWVRELHVVDNRLGLSNGDWILDLPGDVMPLKLERLYAIEFTGARIPSQVDLKSWTQKFCAFPSVKFFSMTNCIVPDGLLLLLSHSFTNLRDLRVRAIKFIAAADPDFDLARMDETTGRHWTPSTRIDAPPPHLVHFTIQDKRFRKRTESFVSLNSLKTVQLLEIHHSGTALFHDEISRTLLPTCGPSLLYLKLSMHRLPAHPPASLLDILQLQWKPGPVNLSRLQTIEINMRPLYHIYVSERHPSVPTYLGHQHEDRHLPRFI